MYVLVLGLDVLGNPFGLLRGMAEGMQDLFYEPYQVGGVYCLPILVRILKNTKLFLWEYLSFLYSNVKCTDNMNFLY